MKFALKAGLLASILLFVPSGGVTLAQTGEEPEAVQEEVQASPEEVKEGTTDRAARLMQDLTGEHVVANIKGEDFTIADLDAYVAIISPGQSETLGQRRLQTLRALVNLQAIAGEAEADGLDQTPEFRLRAELMRQSALQEAYVNSELVGKISEVEVKARYDQEVAALPQETEIRARHILVESEDDAKEIIARLDKGEAFEAIAGEKSTDSSSALGGDIGYFTRGQMVAEFEEAAFALPVGEYSREPVKSPFGWHVIKVEDVRQKAPPALEDARPAITNMLMREQYDVLARKAVEKLGVTYADAVVTQFMQQDEDEPFEE